MASNLNYPDALRNSRMDAITTRAGNGALLCIYSGAQPADADTAIGAQVKLAQLVCGTPFAGAAVDGVLTANAIANDASADNNGDAGFFRLFKSDATTVVMDGTVGTSNADAIINTITIVSGGPVACSALVITAGNV